jgi:peptidoglycan/xylan/chitin deacetylase (PgdA/CDA1 family)
VIYGGKPGTKKIAITFDDSANPQMLRELLELAKKHQIKMVWFLIGKTVNQKVAEIVKEALDPGLIRLGNHSFSHNISEFSKLNRDYIEEEKTKWIERLKSLGISEKNLRIYFRPPGGAGGYRGGDKNLLEVLSQNGYEYLCMWNVEFIYTIRTKYGDYSKENVLKILRDNIYSRKGGNLILFHFNRVDLEAFIEILPELIKNGYQFVFPEEL